MSLANEVIGEMKESKRDSENIEEKMTTFTADEIFKMARRGQRVDAVDRVRRVLKDFNDILSDIQDNVQGKPFKDLASVRDDILGTVSVLASVSSELQKSKK